MPERRLAVAAFANTSEMFAVGAGLRAISTSLSLPADWSAPKIPAHPLSAHTGVYTDTVGTLGRVRVSLEDEALAIDYLDEPPALLPASFRFAFEAGTQKARYIVTPVGVGQRSE